MTTKQAAAETAKKIYDSGDYIMWDQQWAREIGRRINNRLVNNAHEAPLSDEAMLMDLRAHLETGTYLPAKHAANRWNVSEWRVRNLYHPLGLAADPESHRKG